MTKYLVEDLIKQPIAVPIKSGEKEIELWVRPAPEPERNMASAKARRASRLLRKALGDEKSEQYDLLVREEYEGASAESLRGIWANGKLVARAVQIRAASLEEREYVPEPEGVGVTPKDMDEYEDAVDDAEERREEQLTKALKTAAEELDKEAEKIPEEDLWAAAIPQIVEVQCQRAYETEFVSQTILRNTFEDKRCKKPAFKDIEMVYAFGSSNPNNYTRLTNAHLGLMLDTEAVKNLQGGLNPST